MSPILRRSVGAAILGLAFSVGVTAPMASVSAQQPDTAVKVGAESIPLDGMLVALLSPAEVMRSPRVELLPTEVADGWCEEYIGLKPSEIDTAKIILAVPGPGGPMAAAVLKLNRDFDITTLHEKVIGDGQAIDVDGHACLRVRSPADVVLHQVDARTVIVSSSNYLNTVISSDDRAAAGMLAKLAADVSHDGQITVVFAVEPVRPIVTGFLQSMIEKIPTPLIEFTVIPELTDAIIVQLDVEDREEGLRLTLLARDDDSADELQKVVDNGLNMAREMALAQADAGLSRQQALADASRKYSRRLADHIVTLLTPQRSGRRLTLTTSADQGIATQGMLMAFLLPAVQSARFAARRATSQNHLKEIALAMHRHHDEFQALPETAIRDGDGKPLLSWRVKILPFIQRQALYDQFHLNEPWDSPHNLKLLDQMPGVYQHPGVATAAGFTVYQVPVGPGMLFKETGPTQFREVLDGTSNTIMMIETGAERAVEWTKPADIQIDIDDPLAATGGAPRGQFTVVLADGSTRVLDRDIDPETFRALLTRAGQERIDDF